MFLFEGKKFVVVGIYKGIQSKDYTHSYIRDLITSNGGECYLNCSKNTDYIVVPKTISDKTRNNQQVISAKKLKKPIVNIDFIFDSLSSREIKPVISYLVKDLNDNVYENNVYEEHTWMDGRKFFYNKITRLTQWEKPKNFEYCFV